MSGLILYKWRVFCVTEGIYKYVWLDETQGEPSSCPSTTSDTIDAAQNRIVEVRNPDVVQIKEEDTPTGGNSYMKSIQFDALPNQITEHVASFPMPINLLDAFMEAGDENTGDEIVWEVAPKTTVGALTADAAAASTVLSVASTVTDNSFVGAFIHVDDGVNQDDVGRVLSVDKAGGQITVETATGNSLLAATHTSIKLTTRYIDVEIGHPGKIAAGTAKIGTAHFPAGTPFHCLYNNKSLTETKRIVSFLEYLY